jgi:nicotinate-nucleotide adenylyltransferase
VIIVFGGSFNPPTLAHLTMAKLVLKEPGVSMVLWIPVGDDYAKPDLVSCRHRMAMCERLLDTEPKMMVSAIECEGTLAKGSYHTLSALQKQYSDQTLVFLVGADHFLTLPKWIEATRLLEEFRIWIVPRPGYPADFDLENFPFLRENRAHLRFLTHFPKISMSSSEAREQIKLGKIPSSQIHPRVWEYISHEGLYGV